MTPQQQAQYTYHLQQQRQVQLNQQQFATLTRGCSNAGPRSGPMSMSMSSGQMSSGHSHIHSDGQSASGQQMAGGQNFGQNPQFVSASTQGYQQFATLSRAGQKAQQQQMTSGQSMAGGQGIMSTSLYNDYNRLSVQNRIQRQTANSSPVQVTGHQHQNQSGQMTSGQMSTSMSTALPITSISLSQAGLSNQQLQSLTPLQRQQLLQRLHVQQQQQQLYVQQQLQQAQNSAQNQNGGQNSGVHSHGKSHPAPAPPCGGGMKHQPVNFPRKSMVEWSPEDVSDWLVSIGMSDYKSAMDRVTGSRLVRLDANDLTNFGVRSTHHKSYILEKVKQYLHYQQQHPPGGTPVGGLPITHI